VTGNEDVRTPDEISVPVEGGELAALYWAADAPAAPLVVLVHGITGNALAWGPVAAALAGGCQVVAPDLRGRAHSAGLPGPYGLSRHAADVTALLEHFGADGGSGADVTVLVGHSMGGFVAALAAAGDARHLVHGLVLVDGGLPFAVPPAADTDAMLAAFLGSSLDRLDRSFPDLPAVREFWRAHPAVGPWVGDPAVADFLIRDLAGTEPDLHSAVVHEAVRVDGADMLRNEAVLEATTGLPVPATLLWATRGMTGEVPGLYDEVRLAGLGVGSDVADPHVVAREVPDTDHWSILWSPQGVQAISAAVRERAARSS
jgi:pimeloyl-ACP methyl ester carboxylesterase